jgi:hypothetical protein
MYRVVGELGWEGLTPCFSDSLGVNSKLVGFKDFEEKLVARVRLKTCNGEDREAYELVLLWRPSHGHSCGCYYLVG